LLVTDRDRTLVAWAQRAALARQREIVLDDRLLSDLAGEQPETVQNTTELTVRVHADDLDDVRAGRFSLSLVRVSRHAGTSTGRLLDVLDPTDQQRMAAAYAAGTPPITDGALVSQLAAPTRYAISMDVARAPQVLPYLSPAGQFHTGDDPRRIPVGDIAVTADPRRLYLICLSKRRPVQPVPVTAVDPDRQMLPIVRFLAEASTGLSGPCHPFDWGPAARDLPFLPAVRYGRTLLSAARWRLADDDLPGTTASSDTWDRELAQWREITGCPAAVSVGSGDQCLCIDLDLPAHRVLLRDYLTRYHVAVLHQAPAGAGWIGDRPHEIVIPLVATGGPVPAPRLPDDVLDVRRHGVLPGGSRTYLKVYTGREQQDRILTDHLGDLFDPALGSWWFQRYHDPDPHLRLRFNGDDPTPVRRWVRRLRERGLSSRAQLDTDFPEVSRFGGPTAYAAAETVFAADSAAARAQLIATTARGGPPRQAVTAASLLDIATAFLGGPDEARRWLTEHAHRQRPAPDRAVYDQTVRLADPTHTALTAAPSGSTVLMCWHSRGAALAGYRDALHAAGIDPAGLLPDLLHLHHTRIAGPDRAAEAVCLHLARAAALSWAARARTAS
jgi:thiopeptide-type bacteriocin biosynthesis protein